MLVPNSITTLHNVCAWGKLINLVDNLSTCGKVDTLFINLNTSKGNTHTDSCVNNTVSTHPHVEGWLILSVTQRMQLPCSIIAFFC